MNQKKLYIDAQKSCGLKVGDYVRLKQSLTAEDFEMWAQEMYCGTDIKFPVGKTGQIVNILCDRIQVDFNGEVWGLPYFVLEKVDAPRHVHLDAFEKILGRNSDLSFWYPDIFLRINRATGDLYCAGGVYSRYVKYEGNEKYAGTKEKLPDEIILDVKDCSAVMD